MSYHYHFTQNTPTLSGSRLDSYGYSIGAGKAKRSNIDHIARQFEKEHEGITVFVDYDATALRLHLGWTPESKGTAGIVDRIKEFNGLIDAKTLEGKDEYGSDFIVTIK